MTMPEKKSNSPMPYIFLLIMGFLAAFFVFMSRPTHRSHHKVHPKQWVVVRYYPTATHCWVRPDMPGIPTRLTVDFTVHGKRRYVSAHFIIAEVSHLDMKTRQELHIPSTMSCVGDMPPAKRTTP